MSKLEVDKITPQSGTTLTIGDSGDTIVIDSTSVSGAKLAAPTLVGSASSAGSILFKEDTDNGTNAVTLIGPAATADVTLTLPAATDTVVGRQTTDTLTNKTINASQLVDASIATGKLADDAVTYAKMQDTSTANRVLGAASAGTISEVQIATDMIADANVTTAKLADSSVTNSKVASTIITGQTAETSIATDDLILLSDTSASGALKKMTRANFVSGIGGAMTPYFYAYRNANYTISSGTWTKLVLDAEDFDTANGFNVSTGTYTVQTAGNYYFEYSIRSESQGGSATSIRIFAYLERTRSSSSVQRANPGLDFRNNYGTGGTLHGSVILDCQANDTINIYLYHQTTTGSVTVYEGGYRPTYFLGYKLIE